ncbi:hypothetical protein BDN72DRAFT_904764 [Pluteus cervinus]|uniref:Uncharacterized protein n=1 Tax=Pluteus cervinus TaxID=181527 RepID=A0ACD3A5L6_9AGAR|nr:hypothetical protein BDN72DRAFT_904764 [Pluteus cervinus]
MEKMLAEGVTERERNEWDANHNRGEHLATVFGWNKPFSKWPSLTLLHQRLKKEFAAYASQEEFIRLVNFANAMVVYYFPGVAIRFQNKVEEWIKRSNGEKVPHFGYFDNYCWNACFRDQPRVQCKPHTDHKNVVGVCVVIVYEKPNCNFDHKMRSWLVIWDAGIIVEAPPWTALIYPSSLFLHFNIDIQDIDILTLDGDDVPSLDEKEKWQQSSKEGRGSIVFFNQASMFHIETGEVTLTEAKAEGLPSERDFSADFTYLFPSAHVSSTFNTTSTSATTASTSTSATSATITTAPLLAKID